MTLAVANYHDQHGHFPPPYLADGEGRPMHSWRVLILPYIEQDELYKQYDFNEPWNGPKNRLLADRMPKMYALHGEHRPGLTTTNYVAVTGPETVWSPDQPLRFEDVMDRTGSTILVVENRGANIHWMEPRDFVLDEMPMELNHPLGLNSKYKSPAVAMTDGSIRQLRPPLTPETLRALFTRNGGEPLSDEDGGWKLLPDGRLRELR